jgi:hypothetical protein
VESTGRITPSPLGRSFDLAQPSPRGFRVGSLRSPIWVPLRLPGEGLRLPFNGSLILVTFGRSAGEYSNSEVGAKAGNYRTPGIERFSISAHASEMG